MMAVEEEQRRRYSMAKRVWTCILLAALSLVLKACAAQEAGSLGSSINPLSVEGEFLDKFNSEIKE